MEYVNLTYETELEKTIEGWEVLGEFKLKDIQRNREVDFEFLEGRTIDHIEINSDNEIIFTLKEKYDDARPPWSIFLDNLFEKV